MRNFKIKTSVILTTFAVLAHYAPAMEMNIVETRLKRKQQEELAREQYDLKKVKVTSHIKQIGEISEVEFIANEFGLNAAQRRDLEGRLKSCLDCNMSGKTLTSRLRARANHLKKMEELQIHKNQFDKQNIKINFKSEVKPSILNNSTIDYRNVYQQNKNNSSVDFNHIYKLQESNIIYIDNPEIQSKEIISNEPVCEEMNVEFNLEKEVISIVLGISEGTIKKEDVYRDGFSVGEFLKINSQKVTSLNINGDDYTRSEYQNDLEDDFFKIETTRKIHRINDAFIVNYLSTFKGLSSLKLNNIPHITDHSLYFLKNLSNIKHVEIINCSEVTDMAVRNILSTTKLDSLSVQNCTRIRPSWNGTFSKYPLYKLYREQEEALKSGKLLEETSAALKKDIAANTYENMKRNKSNNYSFNAHNNVIFKTEDITLNQDEYHNMCFYPTEIILRDYIPAYQSEDGLRRRDVANNIVMNLVTTFPNITRLDLRETAVTEVCFSNIEKLVTLEYLDTRSTNINLATQMVCENRIATHDFILKYNNYKYCLDSFFFNG